MKMKRRYSILAILMAVIMAVGTLPLTAMADSTETKATSQTTEAVAASGSAGTDSSEAATTSGSASDTNSGEETTTSGTDTTAALPSVESAVLPVQIDYNVPDDSTLSVEAPSDYTDETAKSDNLNTAVQQALTDDTVSTLIANTDKDSAAETASTVLSGAASKVEQAKAADTDTETYSEYTQVATTSESLEPPTVTTTIEEASGEEAITGWEVAATAGVTLTYVDENGNTTSTIEQGDIIPVALMSSVQMLSNDEGISLMSLTTPSASLVTLIGKKQDFTVVKQVGAAGADGKWSVLVQGGKNNTDEAGTMRHVYGSLAAALAAINADTASTEFKVTYVNDYTLTQADLDALGTAGGTGAITRTDKPTIIMSSRVNYQLDTGYQAVQTVTIPDSGAVYSCGFNSYYNDITFAGSGLNFYGCQNDTTFNKVSFTGSVDGIYGGDNTASSSTAANTKNYTLELANITTTATQPIKMICGGGNAAGAAGYGDVNLKISDSTIYGTVVGGGNNSAQTGNVVVDTQEVDILKYDNSINIFNDYTGSSQNYNSISTMGGGFFGNGQSLATVNGKITLNANYRSHADNGVWYTAGGNVSNGVTINLNNSQVGVGVLNSSCNITSTKEIVFTPSDENYYLGAVCGWDTFTVRNGLLSFEGGTQYNSSFQHFMEKGYAGSSPDNSRNGNRDTYVPDLVTIGDLKIENTKIMCSFNGASSQNTWSSHYFNNIELLDQKSVISVGEVWSSLTGQMIPAISGNIIDNGNKLTVNVALVNGYDATRRAIQFPGKTQAQVQAILDSGVFKFVSGSMLLNAGVVDTNYITIYTTEAKNQIDIFEKGADYNSSTPYTRVNSVADALKYISDNNGSLPNDIALIFTGSNYLMSDNDANAFSTYSSGLANKNVLFSFIKPVDVAFTYAEKLTNVQMPFASVAFNNMHFTSGFWNNSASVPYSINLAGKDAQFTNCGFWGNISVNSGSSNIVGKTQNVEITSCITHKLVYNAMPGTGTSVASQNIVVNGMSGGPLFISQGNGTVSGNVDVSFNNCDNVRIIKSGSGIIGGTYKLNATDSTLYGADNIQVNGTSTINLNGNVNVTGKIYGGSSAATTGTSTINILGNVTVAGDKDATGVYDFDALNIGDGTHANAELKIGDSDNQISADLNYLGGGTTTRGGALSLKNEGRLLMAQAAETAANRTVKSIETDDSDTEIAITYNGKTGKNNGLPLMVVDPYTTGLKLPTNGTLRVSTSLIPTHTGTDEYELITFADGTPIDKGKFTWIADGRYYAKEGETQGNTNNQLVLRRDKFAPVVFQEESSPTTDGTWVTDDSYARKLTLYTYDLYRDAIDTTGEELINAQLGYLPSTYAQAYVSTQDIEPEADGSYQYTYNADDGDYLLESISNVTSIPGGSTFTDVNGDTQTIAANSRGLKFEMNTAKAFDQKTNYFLYIRDIAGNWTKFLLDTRAPEASLGSVSSVKVAGDEVYKYNINGITFTDPAIKVDNGTSIVDDTASSGFYSSANATDFNTEVLDEVYYNLTGVDPWVTPAGSTKLTKEADNTYSINDIELGKNDVLYLFARDAYGNKTRKELVLVNFDATSGGVNPAKFTDNDTIKATRALSGQPLLASQYPDTAYGAPILENRTYENWYKSDDTTQTGVDFATYVIPTGVTTFYPNWDAAVLTVSKKVTGIYGDHKKPFTFTMAIKDKDGTALASGTTVTCSGGIITGSGATAPTITSLSVGDEGKVTFTLAHGQTLAITCPGEYETVTITETTDANYTASFTDSKVTGTTQGGTTGAIKLNDENRSFDFTNNRPDVVPSGTSTGSNGNLWGIAGIAVIAGAAAATLMILILRKKNRKIRHTE